MIGMRMINAQQLNIIFYSMLLSFHIIFRSNLKSPLTVFNCSVVYRQRLRYYPVAAFIFITEHKPAAFIRKCIYSILIHYFFCCMLYSDHFLISLFITSEYLSELSGSMVTIVPSVISEATFRAPAILAADEGLSNKFSIS